MTRIVLIFATIVCLSACGTTSTENAATAEGGLEAGAEQQKMRCVFEKTTDSRIGKKVCRPVESD